VSGSPVVCARGDRSNGLMWYIWCERYTVSYTVAGIVLRVGLEQSVTVCGYETEVTVDGKEGGER
jgi:hypothetical protein